MSFVRVIVLALAFACAGPCAAIAHPLGNFTSNHLSRLTVSRDTLGVHYVLDDAEIPTFSLLRSLAPDGRPAPRVLGAWARRYGAAIMPQLIVTIDGQPAPLRMVRSAVRLRPGAAGLSLLYFTADYTVALRAGAHAVGYDDTTLPGRLGWRDVVVAPAQEPTHELLVYPDALIGSPRDVTAVTIDRDAAGVAHVTAAPPNPFASVSAARMDDLSTILARNLSDPLVLIGALALALALGALHALEPGHGKTLLAISLVGARATVRQAMILATALTVAHTAGVLLFGVVVLTLARFIVPETLYPWVALFSGIVVAVMGTRAVVRALGQRAAVPAPAHGHAHDHDHAHDHHHHHHAPHAHDHSHDHGHGHGQHTHEIPGTAPLRFRETLIAAATGNVAPCPAALVVLLAAIATHRVGWGLVLIVAFGIGLALTLTTIGIGVVRGAAWLGRRPQFERFVRFAPFVTAGSISLIGAVMIGEALAAQGVVATPAIVAAGVLATILLVALARSSWRSLPRKAVA